MLKKYVTTGFDASQNELQLLKAAVQALEQPHPFVSLVPPPFQDDLRTELFITHTSGRACKIKVIERDQNIACALQIV